MIGEGTPTPNRPGDYTRRHFEVGYRDLDSSLGVVRNREETGGGDDGPTPMAWGWSLGAA